MMTGALQGCPVVVIGAGVAGLAIAAALAQRGAQVTVLERRDALKEVGAGLQLSPNAMRVIDALGMGGAIRRVSLRSELIRLQNHAAKPVARLRLTMLRPDHEYRMIHRARLIELLAAAAADGGAQIKFGQTVTEIPDVPLTIGADGLRSFVRKALNGEEKPFFTGHTAWRALIPDAGGPAEVQLMMGPGRHLVSYPLAGNLRNLVAVQKCDEWRDEGWSHSDDPETLRCAFAGFGGPVPAWLNAVTETNIWGLFRHKVAARWQNGRQVVIGDAAHPTLPFMAQGAAMAIEDAWILAACLDDDSDHHRALSRFEDVRKPRVTRVVAAADSNARNYHFHNPARFVAHTVLRVVDRFAPAGLLGRFDWIYDYDPTSI